MALVPIVAISPLYPAGPDAWSGQPTKVAPSAGILAYGFVPGGPVSVEFLNYVLSALGTRINDVDSANVLNWPDKWLYNLPAGASVPDFCRATWDQRQLYYAPVATTLCVSYDNGQSWATDDTLAGASYRAIAAYEGPTEDTGAVLATCTVAGAGRVSMRGQTAGWNDQALAGCATPYAVVADPFTGKFLVVGDQTAGSAPGIWAVDANDGATGGTIATAHPTSGAYPLRTVAAGDPYKLAARSGGTGLWRWQDNDVNAVLVTGPGTGNVETIHWDDVGKQFWISYAQGGQPTIWTSPNGGSGTWTARTLPGAGTMTGTIPIGGSVSIGEINAWIFQAPNSITQTFLLCTRDNGSSWFWVGDPLLKPTFDPTVATSRICKVGNGLLVSDWSVAAGNIYISLSLRGGFPL